MALWGEAPSAVVREGDLGVLPAPAPEVVPGQSGGAAGFFADPLLVLHAPGGTGYLAGSRSLHAPVGPGVDPPPIRYSSPDGERVWSQSRSDRRTSRIRSA